MCSNNWCKHSSQPPPEWRTITFYAALLPIFNFVMKKIFFALSMFLLSTQSNAEVHSRSVDYSASDKDVSLKGQLVWDDRYSGPMPGVILVHEWWGLNEYITIRAEQLARMGYVVLAADMYGEGKQAAHPKQAGEWSAGVRGSPGLARSRFEAAVRLLSEHEKVRDEAVTAVGYCFGGSIVLDMAIQGVPLKAVASFHGGLSGLSPIKKKIATKVRVFHGRDDNFISAESLQAFDESMREHAADYTLVSYEGAVHAFTNPGVDAMAEKYEITGLAYNRRADVDSWARLTSFLASLYE